MEKIKLIGSAPNQVSRNKDLGSMAFQNKEAIRVNNATIDNVLSLKPLSAPPSTPSAGDIYFDSSDNKLKCYDGTVWQNCF